MTYVAFARRAFNANALVPAAVLLCIAFFLLAVRKKKVGVKVK